MNTVIVFITLFCVRNCLPLTGKEIFTTNVLNKAILNVSRQEREQEWDPKSITMMLYIFADKNNDRLLSSDELVNFLVEFSSASSKDANTAVQAMIEHGDKDGDRMLNSKETKNVVNLIAKTV